MTTVLWILLLIVGSPIIVVLWVALVTAIATVLANKEGHKGIAPCVKTRSPKMPKGRVKRVKQTVIRLWD